MVRDEDRAIKVVDFGIARRLFDGGFFERFEATERTPGTPAYMAPEQMNGANGDALSDQFAWGVLAYEVLAGKHPWVQRGGLLHLVDQIATRAPEAPSRRRPDVPPEVEAVVLRALSRHLSRYPTRQPWRMRTSVRAARCSTNSGPFSAMTLPNMAQSLFSPSAPSSSVDCRT